MYIKKRRACSRASKAVRHKSRQVSLLHCANNVGKWAVGITRHSNVNPTMHTSRK